MSEIHAPVRVQLSRAKGSKLPPNTVKVDRSTAYGNRFTVDNSGPVHPVIRFACEQLPLMDVSHLRGKNLACWCKLCPMHARGKLFTVECEDCEVCHADQIGIKANG